MKNIFLLVISACLLLTSCIDGDDPKPFFYGFATVEKNPLLGSITFKSDLNAEGSSYIYKALTDVDPNNKLNDGDRVYMSCTIETDYGNGTYDVTVNACSLNLGRNISIAPTAPEGVQDVFMVMNQGYVSKDARQRKYLNLAVSYASKTDNGESFVLGYFEADNTDPVKIVLRLKHYQKEKVSGSANINDVVAFNLQNLPISASQEVEGALKSDVEIKLIIKYTGIDNSEYSLEVPYKF